MRYLLPKELFFVLYFLEQGNKPYKFSLSELGGGESPEQTFKFLQLLAHTKLIEIKNISLDYKKGYFEDFFLLRYRELIRKNDTDGAKKYAKESNMEFMNKSLEPMALSTLDGLFRNLYKGSTPRPIGTAFYNDLLENFEFKMVNTKHLSLYLEQYLDCFIMDKIEVVLDKSWDHPYLKQDFYRYKKQRTLFIQALWRKVDVKKPVDIEINSPEVSTERINFIESWLSAQREGLITLKRLRGSNSVMVDVNEKLLEETIEKEKIPTGQLQIAHITTTVEIEYNKLTGIGLANGKKFKFKDGTPEYRIFGSLFEGINKKLTRYNVLVCGHFYEDGEDSDPAKRTTETSFINDVAKTIREKTGMNTEQLVQNNGNLTLIGSVYKKVRQTNPKTTPKGI